MNHQSLNLMSPILSVKIPQLPIPSDQEIVNACNLAGIPDKAEQIKDSLQRMLNAGCPSGHEELRALIQLLK